MNEKKYSNKYFKCIFKRERRVFFIIFTVKIIATQKRTEVIRNNKIRYVLLGTVIWKFIILNI